MRLSADFRSQIVMVTGRGSLERSTMRHFPRVFRLLDTVRVNLHPFVITTTLSLSTAHRYSQPRTLHGTSSQPRRKSATAAECGRAPVGLRRCRSGPDGGRCGSCGRCAAGLKSPICREPKAVRLQALGPLSVSSVRQLRQVPVQMGRRRHVGSRLGWKVPGDTYQLYSWYPSASPAASVRSMANNRKTVAGTVPYRLNVIPASSRHAGTATGSRTRLLKWGITSLPNASSCSSRTFWGVPTGRPMLT